MAKVNKKIEPAMVKYLDAKLEGNGLFADAVKRKDARQIVILAAQACVGIREKTGRNDGTMVELIQETIGGHSGEAWCMAFVQTLLAYAEVKTKVVSPLFVSEGCDQVWTETDKLQRVKKVPAPGAVIIYGHYNAKGQYTGGHTGIVIAYFQEAGTVHTIEGNTTHGVVGDKIVREGGGVYFNKRSIKGDGDMKIRGYLKPF